MPTSPPDDLHTRNRTPAGSAIPAVHRVEAHLARRFHQVCLGALDEVTQPEGLSPMEYAILGSLSDAPGIDQRRLAERVGIDTVTAHRTVERLEKAGLIDRQIGQADRRSRELRLTQQGTALYLRLRPEVLKAQARVTAVLSEAERATLRDLLTRIIEANEVYARPGNGRRAPQRKAEAAAAQ